ncbi:TPA: fimbrial protein [Salmonella enterica]|uniref:Fimbrial protein n=1 Tax=Salmonella enterica TaxID=28901 RepID=A0A747SUR7_SALER|nr:fimbrial protein [Salmonella enterica]HAF4697599.1 fimbrial protein [Salmonella enterica]
MMAGPILNYRDKSSVKKNESQFTAFVAVALLAGVAAQSVRAEETGTVNFTGTMLRPTCTLTTSSQQTVDFGTISVSGTEGALSAPLVPSKPVTFSLGNCADYVGKVRMVASFQTAGQDSLIANAGSATGVAGRIACQADSGLECPSDVSIPNGYAVFGTVQKGNVNFPLDVSLVPLDSAVKPGAGSVDMTVNFVFDEQ